MFSIKTETSAAGVTHTVEAINAQLASEILEAALSHDFYAEADEADNCRVVIFYIADSELDGVIQQAIAAYDSAPLMAIAA